MDRVETSERRGWARWTAAAAMVCAMMMVLSGCGDDSGVGDGTPSTNSGTTGTNNSTTATNNATTSSTGGNGSTSTVCTPADEVCDGVDNDCDGDVDEGLLGTVAHCGQCGDACDLPNATPSCEAGACVIDACEGGFTDDDGDPSNGCEALDCTPTNAGVEACDGVDNDCDGQIDEDFNVGASLDHCEGCNMGCDLPNATPSCEAGACVIDACEGGFTDDDGDPSNGCEEGPCEPTNGGVEICDGIDNDCDGQVDEDFDFDTPETCGACDVQCAYTQGVAACEAGACVLAACDAGFADLNGDPDDGCEHTCQATEFAEDDIPCDGQDNDCDGVVDEDSGEGEACTLGDGLAGLTECSGGALVCAAEESSGADVCGPLEGLLTAEGGPYRLVCPETIVPEGSLLQIAPGARLLSNTDGEAAKLIVRGQLQAEDAELQGVELVVEGDVSAVGGEWTTLGTTDRLVTVRADALDALVLDQVRLIGAGPDVDARGIVVEGVVTDAGAIVMRDLAISGMAVGVVMEGQGALTLTAPVFAFNREAVRITGAAADVVIEGGELDLRADPAQGLGVVVEAGALDSSITLRGITTDQRDSDLLVRVDPDHVSGVRIEDLDTRASGATIGLFGALDQRDLLTLDDTLTGTVRFIPVGEVTIAQGSRLALADGSTLGGIDGSSLRVEGVLDMDDRSVADIAVDVVDGGEARLRNATWAATEGWAAPCLITASAGAALTATNATLEGHEGLDGLCIDGLSGTPSLNGLTVRGFARGVVLDAPDPGLTLRDLIIDDNSVGVEILGPAMPALTANRFTSTNGRQIIAIRASVGAEPGGSVLGNTFDIDVGDFAYHIDPDNLSTDLGTLFGPNIWENAQPGVYLMSGAQTSANAQLIDLSEANQDVDPFWDVQVIGDVVVEAGARLRVAPNGDFPTLQGLASQPGEVTLTVRGALEIEGPGVVVSSLPLLFEPGSTGSLLTGTFISSRTDFAMIEAEDADLTVGGLIPVACTLTGSGAANQRGIILRASAPMCQGGDSLCPLIAENFFRTLGIGIEVFSPADFSGVNDFDDANPQGDTVPQNVVQR